jgi:hypothetical protein
MPDGDDDPLDRLREQLQATQAAAEALADEAAQARGQQRAGGVPPAGWASPGDHARRTTEVQELAALLQALRDLVPDELQQQLREVIREVLLLVRALIDWWVERIGEPGPPPATARRAPPGQDIPVD